MLSQVDPELRESISAKARLCFGCGVCMGGCPVARVSEGFHPRRLVRELVMGGWEGVIRGDGIWLCAQCHICGETCPQGISVSEIMAGLRRLATGSGVTPPEGYRENVWMVSETGRVSMVTSSTVVTRQRLNLDELKPPDLDEIKALIEGSKLMDITDGREGD